MKLGKPDEGNVGEIVNTDRIASTVTTASSVRVEHVTSVDVDVMPTERTAAACHTTVKRNNQQKITATMTNFQIVATLLPRSLVRKTIVTAGLAALIVT